MARKARATLQRPTCPGCGEPWLRPTQLPGPLPLRLLPAPLRARLAVPELRRAPDDRPDEPTEDMLCQHCGDSMLQARLMEAATDAATRRQRALPSTPGRALDPLRRLRAARRAGRRGDGRRRAGDPRRRDGRPLRPADHDRPAGRRLDRRPGPRRRRRDRRPPDDRAARATRSTSSPAPAPTRSPSTPRRPRTPTARCARSASSAAWPASRSTPARRPTRWPSCAGVADLVLCMTVNPGWGGQPFIAASPDKVAQAAPPGAGQRTIEVDGGDRRRHGRQRRRGGRDPVRRRLGRLRRPATRPRPTGGSRRPPGARVDRRRRAEPPERLGVSSPRPRRPAAPRAPAASPASTTSSGARAGGGRAGRGARRAARPRRRSRSRRGGTRPAPAAGSSR